MIERPKMPSAKRAQRAFVTEIAGLALLATGLGTLSLWLGIVAAGVALVVIGLALERQ